VALVVCGVTGTGKTVSDWRVVVLGNESG
jgi:hypothetical protein